MEHDLPQLTETDLKRWLEGASLERGRNYFAQGAIYNQRRQGSVLRAACHGSHRPSYSVQVVLGTQGVLAGHCSCPVGADGRCKHAAALLLAWLDDPGSFRQAEALEQSLARHSKAELVRLIEQMIQRYPDLERLVELAALHAQPAQEVDPEAIRRQVQAAFARASDRWESQADIAQDLHPILELADDYAEQGHCGNAALVYHTVAEETLEDQEQIVRDEGGDLHFVVANCVRGLANCLAGVEAPAEREAILRALFDIYRWDVLAGGVGIGDHVPDALAEHSAPGEKVRIGEWIDAALPAGTAWSDDYHRQVLGGLWLRLVGEEIDDEAFLDICRNTGRLVDLADRLLALGRHEEAINITARATDYDLLALADTFVRYGQAAEASRLVRERARTSKDQRLVEWLKQQASQQGNLAEALALAESLFWGRPSLQAYQEMRRLAQVVGEWAPLRAQTLARLSEGRNIALLAEIYLDESELDLALQAVEDLDKGHAVWAWGSQSLSLRAAEAVEASRPEAAIRLYLRHAERLIAQRGRDNYAAAAHYLQRVHALYRQTGEMEAWQALIQKIREPNRTLRALQDELKKAGL
jgi:uncharacterized Zn finger protein